MKTKIINDEQYSWETLSLHGVTLYLKGLFRHHESFFSGKDGCQKLYDFFSPETQGFSLLVQDNSRLKKRVSCLKGHFSFVIDTQEYILAFVDRVRAFPLFYTTLTDGTMLISNSSHQLQAEADLKEIDPTSLLEFKMSGYVTGKDTLLTGLFQILPGEALVFDKKRAQLRNIRYYQFSPEKIYKEEQSELIDKLHRVTVEVFSRLIRSLDGRPAWIPLSGGLDSRLILTTLLELKYDNIVTFSYGSPGHPEVERAKAIAEELKVRWHRVTYFPKETRRIFNAGEVKGYFRYGDGLCSTPFLNEFYALRILEERKLIQRDAIFINGQTGDFISGGHIPAEIADKSIPYNLEFLINKIREKHFSLWTNLNTAENRKIIFEKISALLNLDCSVELSGQDVAKYFELWEWQERQSKHVVNGQRVYEWFGYDWRLPLWSDEYMDFWEKIGWEEKLGQKLFKLHLQKKNIGGVFDRYFEPHPVRKGFQIIHKIFSIYCSITGEDVEKLSRKYLHYFFNYAPFYNQKTYFEYIKDSYWHRNPVSYHSREIIKNLTQLSK